MHVHISIMGNRICIPHDIQCVQYTYIYHIGNKTIMVVVIISIHFNLQIEITEEKYFKGLNKTIGDFR